MVPVRPPVAHEGRREVIAVASDPKTSRLTVAGGQPVALEIVEPAVHAQAQFVRQNVELPTLAAGRASGHDRVAPVQTGIARDLEIESLVEARGSERNHWI